jgi:hypothetical protein
LYPDYKDAVEKKKRTKKKKTNNVLSHIKYSICLTFQGGFFEHVNCVGYVRLYAAIFMWSPNPVYYIKDFHTILHAGFGGVLAEYEFIDYL